MTIKSIGFSHVPNTNNEQILLLTGMIFFRFKAEFHFLPRPIPIFSIIFRSGSEISFYRYCSAFYIYQQTSGSRNVNCNVIGLDRSIDQSLTAY